MTKTKITENLAKKQLHVIREFDAPLQLVWEAWTKPTLLDLWWAPKPWKAVTKSMDFKPGGYWLYSMNGPDGEQHWARADYVKIIHQDSFEVEDSFCDKDGNINGEIPGMHWHVRFEHAGPATRIEATITFSTLEDLKIIVEMGFKEGFTAAHDNLDELLKTFKEKK